MIDRLPFLERHRIFATGKYVNPRFVLGCEITFPQDFYEAEISIRIGKRWFAILGLGFNILAILLTCIAIGYVWQWNFALL